MKTTRNQKGFLGKLVVCIIAIFIIAGIFIYFKLPKTLPGDKLYPLKGILEDIRLSFNELNYSAKALIYLDLSNLRVEEIKRLIEKRKYEEISNTLENLITIQGKAIKSIKLAQVHGENITDRVIQFQAVFQNQRDDLQKLTVEVPFQLYDSINISLDNIDSNLNDLKNLEIKR